MKPDNIFLARLGDGRVEPMLLDFGVCKLSGASGALVDSGRPTAAGRMMGTPSYMAPEQVRGDADVDARADVWALGVVLHDAPKSLRARPPERSVITAVTLKRPRRPLTLDVPPMMTSVPPPNGARRSKVLLAAGTGAMVLSAFGLFLTRTPAAPVAARSLPAPSAARSTEPAAILTPSAALRVGAVQVAELRPLAKVATKPAPRTKAVRPIPNYGGRR